jgi:hypothetical protein
MHKTRGNGQLRPLEERMSNQNRTKRAAKIEGRRVVAQSLAREIGLTRLQFISLAGRGFFGRWKWLLFGR